MGDTSYGHRESNSGIPLFINADFLRCRSAELHDINQFDKLKSTTDLGLIRDAANPMARKDRQGAANFVEIYKN